MNGKPLTDRTGYVLDNQRHTGRDITARQQY